jgi:hypothetical protein
MFEQFMNQSNVDNFIMEEFEDANGTRLTIQQFGIGGPGSFALPEILRSGNESNLSLHNLLSQILHHAGDNRIGEDQPVPLSMDILDQMAIKTYTEDTHIQDSCAVCQNPYKLNDLYRTLLCEHNFHSVCIDKWFEDHVTCPICRADMRDLVDE